MQQTRHTALGSTTDGVRTYVRVEDVDEFLAWRLGFMRATSETRAIGGAVDLGFSGKGARVGAVVQGRHWFDEDVALDLSTGIVTLGVSRAEAPFDIHHRAGATASTQLVVDDLIALVARADILPGRRTTAALYGGVQLRSTAAVVGTGVLAALTALAIAVMSDSNY